MRAVGVVVVMLCFLACKKMEDKTGPEVSNFRHSYYTDTSDVKWLVFEADIEDDYSLQYYFFSLYPSSLKDSTGLIPLDYTRFKKISGTNSNMYLQFPLYDSIYQGNYNYRLDVADIQNRIVSFEDSLLVE